MKKYMRTMVEKYFVKNMAVSGHAGNGAGYAEALRRNSYTVLNVSPRAF